MQQEPTEQWELGSGTWLRDRAAEAWRFLATQSGSPVSDRISPADVARLVGARRDPATGAWFPPDFRFSPRTGAPLESLRKAGDASWVPPFGGLVASDPHVSARGLKRTSAALALAPASGRAASSPPDRMLPALPPGQYRFVVDRFDAAWPTLLAIDPDEGRLHLLLPDANTWIALEASAEPAWAHRLPNPRGWRMEMRRADGHSILYCPSPTGLVLLTPSVLGLRCAVEHARHGPALGGPVAWAGAIWTPTQAADGTVHLVGTHLDAAGRGPIVLPTQVPVPPQGFEAPVSGDPYVAWPCDGGQLVLRQAASGRLQTEWLAWPEDVKPIFAAGSPWLQDDGTCWQLARNTADGSVVYVQLAGAGESTVQRAASVSVSTGRVCYRGPSRFEGAPWAPPDFVTSREAVLPLLESARDGAVVGLRMDAPRGVPALLQGIHEPKRAILQVELPGQRAVAFGGIAVKRPWLALPFVHDGHLWIYHPGLPQVPGWKLESSAHG